MINALFDNFLYKKVSLRTLRLCGENDVYRWAQIRIQTG